MRAQGKPMAAGSHLLAARLALYICSLASVVLCARVRAEAGPSARTVRLNNGVHMPLVLWGSGGPTQENQTSTEIAVKLAVSAAVGFPGVDCANHYHNQAGVARGIASSGTPRSALWLTTKVEPCGHSKVHVFNCYNDTIKVFKENLVQLNTPVVDLTLLHSPPCVPNSSWADPQCMWPDQPNAIYPQNCDCADPVPCAMMREQWRALELMYKRKKTRAIGVSNFCRACLECIAPSSSLSPALSVIPAVNQLQFHAGMPGTDPFGLLGYNTKRGTIVQAYSPLGGGEPNTPTLLGHTLIKGIAKSHNVSTAQVLLRWVLQLGYPLATSTVKKEYMLEDLSLWGWKLSKTQMNSIAALDVAPDDPVKAMCLLKKE